MYSMLRTIAEKYPNATFETFKKLKIHFIHGYGDAIRNWSMSLKEEGVFLMLKDQRVTVPVEFKEKDITMIPFLEFYLTSAGGCEESLQVIKKLRDEHKAAANRKGSSNKSSLLKLVDPSIIRLNESKHLTKVRNEGPMSVPSCPVHY